MTWSIHSHDFAVGSIVIILVGLAIGYFVWTSKKRQHRGSSYASFLSRLRAVALDRAATPSVEGSLTIEAADMAETDRPRTHMGDFSWRNLMLPTMLQARSPRLESQRVESRGPEDTSSDIESFLQGRTQTSFDLLGGLSAPPPSVKRPAQTLDDWPFSDPFERHGISSVGSWSQSGSGSESDNKTDLRETGSDLEIDAGQPSQSVFSPSDIPRRPSSWSQLELSTSSRFSFSDGDDALFGAGGAASDV